MSSRKIITALVLSAIILAACSQRPTPEPITLTIEMNEFSFTPNTVELQVGQVVTLILENYGQMDHEMMIGQKVLYAGTEPVGYYLDFWHSGETTPVVFGGGVLMEHSETGGQMEGHDMSNMGAPEEQAPLMISMPTGAKTTTVTFTVTEGMVGEWEIGCFELYGVHYVAGMVGKLIVTP